MNLENSCYFDTANIQFNFLKLIKEKHRIYRQVLPQAPQLSSITKMCLYNVGRYNTSCSLQVLISPIGVGNMPNMSVGRAVPLNAKLSVQTYVQKSNQSFLKFKNFENSK